MYKLNIKAALKSHKIRQQEIVDATGKSKSFVSQVVNGQHMPSMEFFLEIVNALKIPIKDYFEKAEEKEKR